MVLPRRAHVACAALLSLIVLSCANSPPSSGPSPPQAKPAPATEFPNPGYADALIEGVPHVRQKPDFCGEACVEMALAKLGRHVSQDEVFNLSGVDPSVGRGIFTHELKSTLELIGFDPGAVWYRVEASTAQAQIAEQFAALHADLKAGIPSIVCMYSSQGPAPTEHFRLILGYNAAADEVIYHEPAEDNGAYRRMRRELFMTLWPLKNLASSWTLIRLRLLPGKLIDNPPSRPGFAAADYVQHVLALKSRIPPGFTVAVEPPFVVIGDDAPDQVRAWAQDTVRWTTQKLKQSYFTRDPASILDVWLFKNKSSYESHTLELFAQRPTTPYGFYSSEHKSLIMNIATGGGTLVHEIVHPFIEANFPDCPAWFNEGLGSLYEQSADRNGQIKGLPNWRLPALQRAIHAGAVPSFQALTATTTQEFYQGDRGTNYAQARYLCYYLQEKDLLVRFYREFHANRVKDPTGYGTLKRVLGEQDMDAFQARWEAFVLDLSYP